MWSVGGHWEENRSHDRLHDHTCAVFPRRGVWHFPFGNKGLLTDGHYLAFNI